MEVQLQRAKFEGLAAVQGLLKTSLGDTNKENYYLLENSRQNNPKRNPNRKN